MSRRDCALQLFRPKKNQCLTSHLSGPLLSWASLFYQWPLESEGQTREQTKQKGSWKGGAGEGRGNKANYSKHLPVTLPHKGQVWETATSPPARYPSSHITLRLLLAKAKQEAVLHPSCMCLPFLYFLRSMAIEDVLCLLQSRVSAEWSCNKQEINMVLHCTETTPLLCVFVWNGGSFRNQDASK